ncbi:hypothetical protein B7H23_05675 [Notoacmeibacter marinus]|uniref:O-antigen ligase-related domain-containing protein n=1 Tax=Notoacmeibacter marinus TaxID=1876515 RepID=A0A231V2M2_9HYPH|nr:O-antigen ligase family protein [Notoacmeibacter marinus]OXT02387.1 hypothetical protein B7H23_05675 [Notoacmeibacter marinus]
MRSDSSSAVPTSYARYTGYLVYFVIAALPLSFALAHILMELANYQTYRVRREFTGYSQVVLIALLLWGCLKNRQVFDWRILGLMAVPILVLAGHFLTGTDDDIGRALWRWVLIWLFALVFYGAVRSGTIAVAAKGVVYAFVTGSLLYTVFALVHHFGLGHLEDLNSQNLLGFGNVRASTRLFVPAIMCAIVPAALPSLPIRRRVMFLAAALIISLLSGYTGSRSTILALMSISVMAFLLSRGFGYWRIAVTTTAVVGFGLVAARFLPSVEYFGLDITRNHDSGRMEIWSAVFEYVLQSPFFGWGGIGFPDPVPGGPSNAHNIVLQIFYEVGLVGLVSMAILAALFLLRVLRIVQDKAASPYVTATALAACAIMADALVSPALWFQYSAFLFVVLAVMMLTAKQEPRPVGNAVPRGAEGPADSEAAG